MRSNRRSAYRLDGITSNLDTAVASLTGGDPDRPDVQAALLAELGSSTSTDADAIAAIVSGDGTAPLDDQLASIETDVTAVKSDLDDAAAAASGASAGTLEAQGASLKASLEAFKSDLDGFETMFGGSAAPVETNLAAALARIATFDITFGPETSDVAPLVVQLQRAIDSGVPTGLGPFSFLCILLNDSTDAILQTSAFTLTDNGAGSVALLDAGGAGAIYVVTTDADGLAETECNDVAGASGVTVKALLYLENGNGAIVAIGASDTNPYD